MYNSDDTATSVKYKTQQTCNNRRFYIFSLSWHTVFDFLRMKTGSARSINVRIPTGPGAPLPPPHRTKEDSQVLNQFIIAVTKELIFKQVVRVPPVGGGRDAYLQFTTPTKTGRWP